MDITRRHHLRALERAVAHQREHHMTMLQAAKAVLPPLLDTADTTAPSVGYSG